MALPTNSRPMDSSPIYDFHLTDADTGETLYRAHKTPRETWLLASSWAVVRFGQTLTPPRNVIATVWPV